MLPKLFISSYVYNRSGGGIQDKKQSLSVLKYFQYIRRIHTIIEFSEASWKMTNYEDENYDNQDVPHFLI